MKNRFLHTLESCWLCLRFPFLYPRNRFTGRNRKNVLHRILNKLRKKSVQDVTITGKLEKGNSLPDGLSTYFVFGRLRFTLNREDNVIYIYNGIDSKDFDISKIIWDNDKFEVYGLTLSQTFSGNPLIRIHVKTRDENDTANYGFCYQTVSLVYNKVKYFWYKTLAWIDEQVLDRIFFIPTFTELDMMEQGWRKAFGIQMCKDLRKQLIKDHYLFKYRITQIKEKYGTLHWYDYGASREVHDIIRKYEDISWNTCIVCGKPSTKISDGWISPYCDNCFPETRNVYQEKINGEWKEIEDNEI